MRAVIIASILMPTIASGVEGATATRLRERHAQAKHDG